MSATAIAPTWTRHRELNLKVASDWPGGERGRKTHKRLPPKLVSLSRQPQKVCWGSDAETFDRVSVSSAHKCDTLTIAHTIRQAGDQAGVARNHTLKAAAIARGLLETNSAPALSPAVPAPVVVFDDSEDEFIIEWFRGKYHVEITIPDSGEMYVRAAGFSDRPLSIFVRTVPVTRLRSYLNVMFGENR